jgi:hypothetical protein
MEQETKDIFLYMYYHHRHDNTDCKANIKGLKLLNKSFNRYKIFNRYGEIKAYDYI